VEWRTWKKVLEKLGRPKAPSLAAKVSPKRTNTVTINFTVSASPGLILDSTLPVPTKGVYLQKNEVTGGKADYLFTAEFEGPDGLVAEANGFTLNKNNGDMIILPKEAGSGHFKYVITVVDGSTPQKRATQTVEGVIDENFTIPSKLVKIYPPTSICPDWALHPDRELFLKTWLLNYFDKINFAALPPTAGSNTPCQANTARFNVVQLESLSIPPCFPDGTQFQNVDLKTQFVIALDVSAGVTPAFFGGTVFLIPVSGVSGDFNPDYQHSIDVKMAICDSTTGGCTSAKSGKLDEITPIHIEQCYAYAVLNPTIADAKGPQDVMSSDKKTRLTCSKACGCYVPENSPACATPPNGQPVCSSCCAAGQQTSVSRQISPPLPAHPR
jgi:hypothetical protein